MLLPRGLGSRQQNVKLFLREPLAWITKLGKGSPEGYAIVPPQQVKIAQPVIVQYVAPPNMLWYAPYCTIQGAAQDCPLCMTGSHYELP